MSGVLVVVLSTIVSAGASAAAAWWGGKLGVRREAEKLIQARAFDRRLDWYERAIRSLETFSLVHGAFIAAVLRSDAELKKAKYAEISQIFPETMTILYEGQLYGRPSTTSAIADFAQAFGAVMSLPSGSTLLSPEQIRKNSRKVEDAIGRVSIALVREAREHMRLEELPHRVIWGREPVPPSNA